MKKGLYVNEAASYAGVTSRTISNWCAKGKLTATKDARGRLVITEASLKKAVRER
jgi:excisionase family DNA binding protein